MLIILAASGLCLGAATCSPIRIDPSVAAVVANDKTAIIEGCGHQPIVGYTYCRVMEGDASNVVLKLHLPPAKCRSESCASYKFLNQTGDLVFGGTLPKGQTVVVIPWEKLTGKPVFDVNDRGYWAYLYEVYWTGPDGRDYATTAEGEIRMRVHRKDYAPLHAIPGDAAFGWSWIDDGRIFLFSTAGRAYTGLQR